MGRDKARLTLDGGGPAGRNLAEHAARRLEHVCRRVLVADRGRGVVDPTAGWASVTDGPGRGPAAGILGAARVAPGRALLVLACDLPAVPVALLAALATRAGDGSNPSHVDWVVPEHDGRLEPLVALYRPGALAALARRVAAGEHALHPLAHEADLVVERLAGAELDRLGRPEEMFVNLNDPDDLARFISSARPPGPE